MQVEYYNLLKKTALFFMHLNLHQSRTVKKSNKYEIFKQYYKDFFFLLLFCCLIMTLF